MITILVKNILQYIIYIIVQMFTYWILPCDFQLGILEF